MQRTVLISEPHPYRLTNRYGGHQYADVFAKHGWKVLLFSSNFCIFRLLLPQSRNMREFAKLWGNKGKRVNKNIINYCIAHLLPSKIRYIWPFKHFSCNLFIPSLRSILKSEGVDKVNLLWLNGNCDGLYRNAVRYDKMVVRLIDNYAGFKKNSLCPSINDVLRKADAVFSCSNYVKNIYRKTRDDIMVIPNGVDYERFAQKIQIEPTCLKNISQPRIIYVGAIREWFDVNLLREVAKIMPKYSFIIVGPYNEKIFKETKQLQNVHILGEMLYEQIPNILAYSDVGIVPFKECNLIRGVSPIKVYEYLAAGLPVVSIRWKELEIQSLPIILAKNAVEFVQGIKTALQYSSTRKIELRNYAQKCSWEQRLKELLENAGIEL